MKFTFIFLIVPMLFFAGCSTPQYTISPQNMEVGSATYQVWSQQPPAGSDIPERGIDLRVTVKNWPQGYEPAFIVYDKRKSVTAQIAGRSDGATVIKARIIQASSVLVETSETVDLSDRLVFTDAVGNKGYLPIKDWESEDKQVD